MKIFLTTHYTENWSEIAKISVQTMRDYADKHGYNADCVIRVKDYQKYDGAHKFKALYWCLENDGDVAMVLDADTLITNHRIMVEDFLDDEHDAYFSEGLNCGVFIIRKSEWSDKFLAWLWEDIEKKFSNCEQDALEKYMKLFPNDSKIKVVPHPCFNSFIPELYPEIKEEKTEKDGRWIEGKSFILHLPALALEHRLSIMKNTPIIK